MPTAFIAYVREDSKVAAALAAAFRANGIEAWIDIDNLQPGQFWRDAIRGAITAADVFIPLFSKNWEKRERTVANDELTMAIEELRLRQRGRGWFLPLRVDDCAIPDRPISHIETVRDLHFVDQPALGWRAALERLLGAMGVERPIVPIGEPLAAGLPGRLEIVGGEMVVERTRPAMPTMDGMVFAFSEGWVTRSENGRLWAHLVSRAPNVHIQELNEQFGLDAMDVESTDQFISSRADRPNTFAYVLALTIPRGTRLWQPQSGQYFELPIALVAETSYRATGHLEGNRFAGAYVADYSFNIFERRIEVQLVGTFYVRVREDV